MSRMQWPLAVTICLLIACASPAAACTMAPGPADDPSDVFGVYPRDDIVKKTEVIVEGVIEPAKPDDVGITFARMHVDRVWKGAVASDVVVIMGLSIKICSSSSGLPPFGERMRFSARLVKKRPLQVKDAVQMTPEQARMIATHDDFLLYGAPSQTIPMVYLPLEDPELDRLLVQYQTDTETLQRRAESGDRAARLAYAAHLFENNEQHRALTEYEGVLRDDPSNLDLLLTLAVVRAQVNPDAEPEDTLGEIERRAPRTPEWQRKIVHARFVASGRLTSGWKDWSDLKRSVHCEVSEGNFDDANFDRADLATCEFVRSSFRNASLLHADLSEAYFEDSTLTGARYDCATKLPENLDPKVAGMINVEGQCAIP